MGTAPSLGAQQESHTVTTYEVQAVIPHDTVTVAYCVDPDGTEVAVAVESPMADTLRHELDAGRRPRVLAEDWQIVVGYRDRCSSDSSHPRPRRRPSRVGAVLRL